MKNARIAHGHFPAPVVVLFSVLSGTKVVSTRKVGNFKYLAYPFGACVKCNRPLRADDTCPKHGLSVWAPERIDYAWPTASVRRAAA